MDSVITAITLKYIMRFSMLFLTFKCSMSPLHMANCISLTMLCYILRLSKLWFEDDGTI